MRARVRPTARGVIVGVAALLLASYGILIGAAALVAAGFGVLVGVLADVAMLGVNRLRLAARVVREVEPNPCFSGQSATVTLSLTSRSGAPVAWGSLPVRIDDRLPSAAGRMSLDASPSYQVVPSQRGAWRLGPATITATGPLGCWCQTIVDTRTTDLIAWPEVVDLGGDREQADRPEDRLTGHRGLPVARLDDMVLRDYQPGDDLRRVHWRSSAHTGQLMTRVDEPAESRHAWVALWVGAATPAADLDLAISLVASCVLAWQRSGFTVECHCGLRRLAGDASAQLTELALLDPATDPDCLAAPAGPGMVDGPAVLIVCPRPPRANGTGAEPQSRVDADLVPGAIPPSMRDAPSRQPRLALLLQPDDAGERVLRDVGWQPVPVPPDTSLDEAARPLADMVSGVAA
jgi:uncharacterized protein (DUF58 family)